MHGGNGSNLNDLLLRTGLGVFVTIVLIGLLTQKEMLDAYDGPRARRAARVLAIISAPIFLLFAAIVFARFQHILHRG
jgi:hypothetical protein